MISPRAWLEARGADAAAFYGSVFDGSPRMRIAVEGPRPLAVELFTMDDRVSMQIDCGSQREVDEYWRALVDGGEEGPCGWLRDRFGVSWQVLPTRATELLGDGDADRSQRVARAMLRTSRIDIAALEAAAATT